MATTPGLSTPDPTQQTLDNLEGGDEPVAQYPIKLDIEHAIVKDDPRKWSKSRKVRRSSQLKCILNQLTILLVCYRSIDFIGRNHRWTWR